jgi:hypothetical protein
MKLEDYLSGEPIVIDLNEGDYINEGAVACEIAEAMTDEEFQLGLFVDLSQISRQIDFFNSLPETTQNYILDNIEERIKVRFLRCLTEAATNKALFGYEFFRPNQPTDLLPKRLVN